VIDYSMALSQHWKYPWNRAQPSGYFIVGRMVMDVGSTELVELSGSDAMAGVFLG
jgi:hypothetical protein